VVATTSLACSTKDFSKPLCFSKDKLSKISIGDVLAIIEDGIDVNAYVDE